MVNACSIYKHMQSCAEEQKRSEVKIYNVYCNSKINLNQLGTFHFDALTNNDWNGRMTDRSTTARTKKWTKENDDCRKTLSRIIAQPLNPSQDGPSGNWEIFTQKKERRNTLILETYMTVLNYRNKRGRDYHLSMELDQAHRPASTSDHFLYHWVSICGTPLCNGIIRSACRVPCKLKSLIMYAQHACLTTGNYVITSHLGGFNSALACLYHHPCIDSM